MITFWTPICRRFTLLKGEEDHILDQQAPGVLFMTQGCVCDRGLLSLYFPKWDLYHRVTQNSVSFLLHQQIESYKYGFDCDSVFSLSCLSRHRAKLSPSNSQSFSGICSLFKKGLLAYTLDHFILLALCSETIAMRALPGGLPWPLLYLSGLPHI